MTTPCQVHLYATSQDKARRVATNILEVSKKLEAKYNFFDKNSYLTALNQRKITTIDSQTKDILKQAKYFYE